MLKKSILLIAVSAAVTATVYFALRPRKSHATDISENVNSLFVLGDSQTKRHIGEAYKEVFSDLDVNYFGKEGATHEDYLKDLSLLDNLQCSDIIVIQLGDNGVSNRTTAIENFIHEIKARCPNSIIFWGGPMKPVAPTIPSNYVTTTDTSSFKYLPSYIDLRRTWDSKLQNTLEPLGVHYVSNIDLQESQPLDSAFSDSRGGDGIHLERDSAVQLAQLMHQIIFPSNHEVL